MNGRSFAVVVVLGLVALTVAVPVGGQDVRPAEPDPEDWFSVDGATTTTPVDVGDHLRVCAEENMSTDEMGWTFNNTPISGFQDITGDVNDSVVLEVDTDDCIQITSCRSISIAGTQVDERCNRDDDGQLAPDTNEVHYDALADCFCVNETGRLSIFYRVANISDVDGRRAWLNLTVQENQELYDSWRTNATQAESQETNATLSFASGGLPFFSNVDPFAEPLFWLGMAVVLYVNGWLISGTYFVVGYMGNFLAAGETWLADDLLLGLAGLFLMLEFGLNFFARRIKRALRILRGRPVETVEPSEEERV